MNNTNVEIKARCESPQRVRDVLRRRGASFSGEDRQVDTYFESKTGRLKLREGAIENSLIYYERDDQAGPKVSRITRFDTGKSGDQLKQVLTSALRVVTVVDKRREIYFDRNVKIHIDVVDGLGSFVEIEAIDSDGSLDVLDLEAQCRELMDAFEIQSTDLLNHSYSDMVRGRGQSFRAPRSDSGTASGRALKRAS